MPLIAFVAGWDEGKKEVLDLGFLAALASDSLGVEASVGEGAPSFAVHWSGRGGHKKTLRAPERLMGEPTEFGKQLAHLSLGWISWLDRSEKMAAPEAGRKAGQ